LILWRQWALHVTAIAIAVTFLTAAQQPSYVVGAYYYGWYDPRHWGAFGFLGPRLPDPVEPALGIYNSADPGVVAAHVGWADEYGIDFFILEWPGRGTPADRQARDHLLPALAASSVRQAPVIETLVYDSRDVDDPEFRRRLRDDVRYLGEHYLQHPSAMRVQGKPVLFIYVTRILHGDVPGLIAELRADLRSLGVDPFIVADEVFWEPGDRERVRAYDAITAYNAYDWPITRHGGWAQDSTFFQDVDSLFARWSALAREEGVAFVPNVMPGYNDRGVRLEEDHYVIPRQMRSAGRLTGFLEQSIALAQRHTDPALRMVTITSFNEWHEWTQIEPARRITPREPEPDPSRYTEDYPHPPYTFEYLQVIRDRLGK
jgi:hypothetical protein